MACAALGVAVVLLAQVPQSLAASSQVLVDWRADGKIDGSYSLRELDEARNRADATELEYSNLPEQLAAAEARAQAKDPPAHGKGRPVVAWITAAALLAGAVIELARRMRRRRGGHPAP